MDECSQGTNNCDANAICSNTNGSYTCSCNEGYEGDGFTCSDIDECDLGTDNCDANASCQNTPGGYTCSCNTGYSGNGVECTDIDECLGPNNCDANAICLNNGGGYTCTCDSGYTGDGLTCTKITEAPSSSPSSSPSAPPTPATTTGWQEIFFDDFESGTFEGWIDGGADARFINNENNAHSGTFALRIQDDTSSSTVTSPEIDTTSFNTVKIDFFFKPKRMIDSWEKFHVDISTNGGASFTHIRTWTSQDMTDNSWNQGIIDGIDVSGTDQFRIRFECEGDTNQDRVFIDDVKVEGK